MSTDEFNPYHAPAADLDPDADSYGSEETRPVPFEDLAAEPRFWPRIWAMFGLLFRNPMELVDRVPVTQSLTAPWRFLIVLGIPVYLFWLGILALMFFVGMMASLEHASKNAPPTWLFAFLPLAFLVLLPLIQFVGMLFVGLLNHGLLWLWGGLRQGRDLNTTLRTCGYLLAFFSLVSWIPFIGSIALLAAPAALGVSLARLHRTDTWRGVCAAYTPLLFCCCGYALFFLAMMVLGATGVLGK
jgi:hypothetical protein